MALAASPIALFDARPRRHERGLPCARHAARSPGGHQTSAATTASTISSWSTSKSRHETIRREAVRFRTCQINLQQPSLPDRKVTLGRTATYQYRTAELRIDYKCIRVGLLEFAAIV